MMTIQSRRELLAAVILRYAKAQGKEAEADRQRASWRKSGNAMISPRRPTSACWSPRLSAQRPKPGSATSTATWTRQRSCARSRPPGRTVALQRIV